MTGHDRLRLVAEQLDLYHIKSEDPQEAELLQKELLDRADVFSVSDNDCESTALVEHRINTGGHPQYDKLQDQYHMFSRKTLGNFLIRCCKMAVLNTQTVPGHH